jgi:excisionase family DNA binding protein
MMRVSVYTVRRWILDGALPASKVGRGWRISERAIKAWLEQQRAGAIDAQ